MKDIEAMLNIRKAAALETYPIKKRLTHWELWHKVAMLKGNEFASPISLYRKALVPERNLLERWGTHRGRAELVLSAAEGKGKASPLEAGRGKYYPPANPERVTSKALKRRDKGFLSRKI